MCSRRRLQQQMLCTADACVTWSVALACLLQQSRSTGVMRTAAVMEQQQSLHLPEVAPCSCSSSSQRQQLGLKAFTLLVAMQIDDDIVFIQEGAIQALLNEKLTNDRCGEAAGLTAEYARGLTASYMMSPYRSLPGACTGPAAGHAPFSTGSCSMLPQGMRCCMLQMPTHESQPARLHAAASSKTVPANLQADG